MKILYFHQLLLSSFLLLSRVQCDLFFPTDDTDMTQVKSIPSYSMLNWNKNFFAENLVVLELQPTLDDGSYDFSLFDWCDLDQYTPSGILPLLNANNITQFDLDNGLEWAGIFISSVQASCPNQLSLSTAYTLNWDERIAIYIQRAGAKGSFISFSFF